MSRAFSFVLSCLLLLGVGGFLLSHNLPVAVPSALAGLASGFGMGTGRFPAAIGHRQTHGASCAWLRVLCQILCSGREATV